MNSVRNLSLNKKNSTLLKVFLGAIVLFLFLGALNIFRPQIRNYFYLASNPIESKLWTAGESVSNFASSVLRSGSLASENESLKSENQKLLSNITLLQSRQAEILSQQEAVLTYQDSGFQLLMAAMMGLDGADLISIDKGSEDGVKEGMSVVNQQNVLFGKVFKVYKNFSQVMLISNKDSVINVKILQPPLPNGPEKEVYGVVKGNGGLDAHLDFVPIDDTINNGDVMLSSALEGSFPKDLLIGSITEVIKNDQSPHQQAKIKLFLNLNSTNLFVVTNYKLTDN
jgi:rod shape-determining protein MreC